VCFLVMYHYETNAIFAILIPGLDSKSILEAYKNIFEYLVSKGYKPKVNVMDNQATKAIKEYLVTQQCELQLVEPHNHQVNAAERAIQTFKNRFTGALSTTDSEFPVQLLDKLAPQVQDSINLLQPSQIDPTKSAYEILEGPYDWNRYPLAPLGTRAIIYEDPEIRESWAPCGLDTWLLGPSKDHYRCNLYYVPETRGYRVSAAADLFPQHCIAPSFTPESHVKELSNELQVKNNGTEDTHLTGPARPGHSHGSVYYRQSTPSARTKGGTKGDGRSPTHQSPANSKGDRYSKDAECK
jgi:hypothetical protein